MKLPNDPGLGFILGMALGLALMILIRWLT